MKMFKSKKFIAQMMVAFIAFVACINILAIRAKADTPGTVNDNNVNIRSSSSASSNSLGKVNSGDKVTIVEEVKNDSGDLWYKVSTSVGVTGYIKADFVTKGEATTNTNTNTNTTTTTTTTTNVTSVDSKSAYISGDVVNIRSQASATSDLIAKANQNSEVTVVGEAQASDGYKWYQVTFTVDGVTKKGFIRSDLLTFTKPTNAPAETTVDTTPTTPAPTETPTTPDSDADPSENIGEPAPAPGDVEPTEPTPSTPDTTVVNKKFVTPMEPFEDPAIIPAGFDEVSLGDNRVKGWNKGDFYLMYGVNEEEITGWYIFNSQNEQYIPYDGLFEETKGGNKGNAGTVFGIQVKWILVALIVVIIALLGAVFFLALKASKGVEDDDDYDYDDYDDEDSIPVSNIEEDEEPVRSKARQKEAKPAKEKKGKSAKDKFLDYFSKEVDDEDMDDDEYYSDVDDDEDIDFIDI